jgi:hypothetical protein
MMTDIVERLRGDAKIWRAPHLSEAAEIERLRAAVADERASILRLIESERARVPAGGEYYAGYREALLNLETAIRAREQQ